MKKNEEIVHTKNLVKHYHLDGVVVKAINGVSFSIPRNKMTVIIGPSGCGKSTLLHLIGLLDKPTRGKIYFDGHDVSKLDEKQLAKLRLKKIGFVFQFFNLHPLLTAAENVELPLTISNIHSAERRKKALELLKTVGLKERADHYPNQLSGGEQQRVAIARAMSNDPEIIMADEPTGNLDTKSGDDIMRLLVKLRKKATVIVITHDSDIARRANKTIRLRDGVIVSR